MRSRVIPGSLVTIDRRVPVKRLKSVDFPTFGRPTITMEGSFCVISAARQFPLQVQPPREQSIQFLGRSFRFDFFLQLGEFLFIATAPQHIQAVFRRLPAWLSRRLEKHLE